MRLYSLCKRIIESTTYTSQAQKDEMKERLDILFANGSLDIEQYNELVGLLEAKPIAT